MKLRLVLRASFQFQVPSSQLNWKLETGNWKLIFVRDEG